MPWKRNGSKQRGRGKRTDRMNGIRKGERAVFILVSKAVVLVLFAFLAVVGAASNFVFVSALAAVGVFVMAAVILPIETVRDHIEMLWSGEAGEWAHSKYCSLMPFRKGGRRGKR